MKKHIGSTLIIVLGVLSILAGINQISNHQDGDSLLLGFVLLLGGLAYRSAKKRYLGEGRISFSWKIFEAVLLAAMLAAVLLQNNFLDRAYFHPIANVIVPILVLIAYVVIFRKIPKSVVEIDPIRSGKSADHR